MDFNMRGAIIQHSSSSYLPLIIQHHSKMSAETATAPVTEKEEAIQPAQAGEKRKAEDPANSDEKK